MRFEILAGKESSGKWHTVVRARLHREVLVAQTPLRRGQAVRVSDFALEKRDALQFRDALSELPSDTSGLDLTENLLPGTPLTARSIQARPVIRRGELVEALFVDGAMTISLKVEALENGAPGQTVRVRNIGSRKEIRGKVRDEQTIVVSM
jgi:flagella basal body P-ring formation protein FlgA